jgi:hypothetical protein
MDKMTHYRDLLKRLLSRYIDLANRSSHTDVRSYLISDDQRQLFLPIGDNYFCRSTPG